MKKKYLLSIVAGLIAFAGNCQIVIMNGDTVINAIIPANNIDTIYYCSSINVSVQNHDTVGLAPKTGANWYWGSTIPGKRILTTTSNFVPLVEDTTLGIVYAYYRASHLIGWNDTSADGWYDYNDTASAQVKWYTNAVHLIKKIPASKICWVTVDSNFAHNVIIWDTTGFTAQGIDSVKLYYYITITNKKLLATCYKNRTYYVDSVNSPNSGTFKYLLAGVNTCGNEDTNSAWQTTAWIQQTGSTFTVASPYMVEGNPTPVSYYILYRDTTGTGHNWDSIFETPGTVLNDPNFTNYPNAKYYVAAVLNLPGCSAPGIVDQMESVIINKSRSNRLSNQATGIEALSSLNIFNVYPNPSDGFFTVAVTGVSKVSLVKIYSIIGQEIFMGILKSGNNAINLHGQSSGIYLYKFLDKEGGTLCNGKLIIE